MRFDLVYCRGNSSGLEQLFRLRNREVADSNAADFSSLYKLLEHSPGVGNRNICQAKALGDWVDIEECVGTVLESYRPMNLMCMLVMCHGNKFKEHTQGRGQDSRSVGLSRSCQALPRRGPGGGESSTVCW